MKIAILVAGDSSRFFPLFIDKPKCLYHLNGKVQLEKVIEDAKNIVEEEDIIVVAGYKYKYIKEFLTKYPKITLKINYNYHKSSIYSFRKAIEGVEDDFIFMFGDESISLDNIKKIAASQRKAAILCHDDYYYYALGIIKLRNDSLYLIRDDKYLDMNAIKEIYCFANNKNRFDSGFNINSGICIGYIMIDWIRRIGDIKKIENPVQSYKGDDIDFIYFNSKKEYIPDLDYFKDTNEYEDSVVLRIYSDYFSDVIKGIIFFIKRAVRYILRRLRK